MKMGLIPHKYEQLSLGWTWVRCNLGINRPDSRITNPRRASIEEKAKQIEIQRALRFINDFSDMKAEIESNISLLVIFLLFRNLIF
jgi:hypothetical protein